MTFRSKHGSVTYRPFRKLLQTDQQPDQPIKEHLYNLTLPSRSHSHGPFVCVINLAAWEIKGLWTNVYWQINANKVFDTSEILDKKSKNNVVYLGRCVQASLCNDRFHVRTLSKKNFKLFFSSFIYYFTIVKECLHFVQSQLEEKLLHEPVGWSVGRSVGFTGLS